MPESGIARRRRVSLPSRPLTFLCLLFAPIPSAFGGPVNLIRNPGFEDGLAGWTRGFGEGAQVDEQVSHSGAASARISVEDETCALDAEPLVVGYDIDPGATYRVSAWIKSGGVRKGSFAGRVYCYGPGGEYLAMHTFGMLTDGAPPGEWKQAAVELEPGGKHAIPPETDHIVLRFSIWAKDQKCAGTVWVDDVEFIALGDAGLGEPPGWLQRSEKGAALVLKDDLPAAGAASDPDAIADLLSTQGLAVNLVSADRLAEPGALNPRWVDLVVLPYGGTFPADARDAFVDYVRFGGSFLTLGGLPFDRFMRRVDGEWMDVTDLLTDAQEPAPIAHFDGDEKPQWDLAHAAADEQMTAEYASPGANGSKAAAHLSCDLQAYAYAGIKEAAAPDAEHSALCFWAKGDAKTDRLAVELRGGDGSRWKKVLPLTEHWRFFAIPAGHFLSYASEGRGGPEDSVRPEQVAGVWFGFTTGMVGKGEHVVWVDGIEWRRVVKGAGRPPGPIRPVETSDLTLRYFGSNIPLPSDGGPTVPIFTPLRRFEGATELRATGADPERTPVATGRFSGYLATAPSFLPRNTKGRDVTIGGPHAGRLLPLLEAYDEQGNALGPAGGVYLPARRTQRSAVWAFFGVDNADLVKLGGEAFAEVLRRIIRMATGAPAIESPEMTFTVADAKPCARINVSLRGQVAEGANIRLEATATSAGKALGHEAVELRAAGPISLELRGLPPTLREYEVRLSLLEGEEVIDTERISVDARRCLLDVVNWLLENQKEDGTYSGVSFQDNRAARGLLGACDITGDERYRDSAIRWGEEMIRLQREDGGYRMGYGITAKGESCYVADGGEIAIAMARLVSYTEGDQRQRFIDSVKAYMGYREDFREPNGAIGVGWCLHDYGKRPIEPLDKPTRIYAGERNAYTIGCTLAAAAAYASITGDPADKAMALRDTEWLLEHYRSLSGAAVESAIWAHHYVADDDLKRRIEEHMLDSFNARIIRPSDRGWLGGGGRSVLDLDAIAYWTDRVKPEPEMQAAFGRWLHALCGANSSSAARHLLNRDSLNGAEKRFICFLSVALADAVQPMVSMKRF